MTRILALVLLLTITGCSTTVPVVMKFPEAPSGANQACPPLILLEDDSKLSEVAKTVTDNYGEYHKCANKTSAWIEWYQKQKSIYESVK